MTFADLYRLTGEEKYCTACEKTYRYLMDRYYVELNNSRAVMVDREHDNEIRLGGLGLAILSILMYAEITGDRSDLPKAEQLGSMICSMQDADGRLDHVLQYPSLQVKDKFRIVYYSGEACYGLMRLYAETGSEVYLDCVRRAFDYFIRENYDQYFDHWLSYACNELTRYLPEDRYFAFGLRNAFCELDFIRKRDTTWPTFLELLNAAVPMVKRIQDQKKEHLLKDYNIGKLCAALEERVRRQLNGILFPEQAMFFHNPQQILYGVFIRHHSFRIRNDDVAHHLVGCCNYLNLMQSELSAGFNKNNVNAAI